MTIRSTIRDRPVAVLYGLIIVSLAGLLPLPPLLQDQNYHQFADQRELFGIPNFWNVVSNLPFIAVGAAGLLRFRANATSTILFFGVFLTGFGSSYYHLYPADITLFWDRLPMTFCFAAILAAVVEERVDAKAGAMLLRPLLAIGIFSLLLWRWTDDLRLYAWAQFFPFLALVLILRLFPPKYTGAFYWIVAAALYALAKLLEFYDHPIFFGRLDPERACAQAPRCGCCRLRNPEAFSSAPANRWRGERNGFILARRLSQETFDRGREHETPTERRFWR